MQSTACGDHGCDLTNFPRPAADGGWDQSVGPGADCGFQRSYPGEPWQVRQVREDITRAFNWCLTAGELVLVASELATNAIRHSRSGRGGQFTVTVRVRPGDFTWIGVEDQGGRRGDQEAARDADRSLGKGLVIVNALAGDGHWGLVPITWTGAPCGGLHSPEDPPGRLAWACISEPQSGLASAGQQLPEVSASRGSVPLR
jgi:anti-sigma regulatory factor (Ser/Thr protein kinase)